MTTTWIGASLSYKSHIISTRGVFSELTQQWHPVASITWKKRNGSRGIYILRNSVDLFSTFIEAKIAALAPAKAWIDLRAAELG